MPKKLLTLILFFFIFIGIGFLIVKDDDAKEAVLSDENAVEEAPSFDPFSLYRDWKRPDGPPKVGIQVGHWKINEVPDELENLRTHTGSSGGGKAEWEVNMAIAKEISRILKEKGVDVELLPATVPSKYWADVFIAIHADGSTDKSATGYKFAAPWRDFNGKADSLVHILDTKYKSQTKLSYDPNITRNMRGYYAFSWWRYEHAVHPMTTSVIAETGFLTNKNDQKLLINHPEIPAKAIGEGILEYLEKEELI